MMKRKKRISPRPAHPIETTEKGTNPIGRLTEPQEDRYDPGYNRGGNTDPLFIPWRPNKYGYFLIVVATMLLMVLVAGIRKSKMDGYAVAVTTAFMLFLFLVGFKLIKHPTSESRGERRRRPSHLDD
jgi:hypothetical protein